MQLGDVPDTWADVDDLVARCRLPTKHAGRRGHSEFRRLVPRILQREIVAIQHSYLATEVLRLTPR